MRKTYRIDVDCANCANKMEQAANKTPGVKEAVVNFMTLNEMEKMTLDDGSGNKAKLSRRKDGSVLVECTSSNVL